MKLDSVIYFILFLLPIAFAAVLDQTFGVDEPDQEVQLVESSQKNQLVPLVEQTESTEVSESAKENEKDQCSNRFAKFHDLAFVKENILDYLPIKEQFMFMCTSTNYYRFLEILYDQTVKSFLGRKGSYNNASDALKADIIKLWKYFRIELSSQNNSRTKFEAAEIFYDLINSKRNNSKELFKAISDDNYENYKNYYGGSLGGGIGLFSYPYFPQLSLILLKTNPKNIERCALIKNACYMPFLFKDFLKYLTRDVYGIKRKDLCEKLKNDYPKDLVPKFLDNHHNRIKEVAFTLTGLKCLTLSGFLLIAYQFVPREFDSIELRSVPVVIVLTFILIWLRSYRMKFENFEEFELGTIRTQNQIDLAFKILMHRINNMIGFKWEPIID